ncbi:MAG: ATP-binding protein, partial [Chromatiales bacterium]|nr:ATP-binding protein [Chromatiales bacterium]
TDNTTKGIGAKGAPVKGEWEDKLTRFLSRLEAKLDDRRYGFMFAPPPAAMKYDWLAAQVLKLLQSGDDTGIKVIDFSEVPADVLPVVTGTLARLLYDVQFWMNGRTRTPVTLLCDEAHLYLPVRDDADAVQRQALGSFERIAKEGRKYGFSLLVVSQRPSDVSRTILSQCNNFLALRLTNETDQGVIKRLMPDSLAGLTSILPLLDTGEALLLGDAVLLPTRIKLDMPKVAPDSATRDFWKEWGSAKPDNATIAAAIECLRGQSRSG